MFNLIDRIVSLDLGQRGMGKLYEPARARQGEPLCLGAARHLADLRRGEHVIFLTGSIVRGWVSPAIPETDGPIGVAALARALNFGLNVIPVVLTDPPLVYAVAATLEMAGLTVVDEEHARAAAENERFTGTAIVDTCSTDKEAARADAGAIIERLKPRVVIAVERAGMTRDGTFRNSVGQDTSEGRAFLDFVILKAAEKAITTVGIGDLGNEIGMGAISEAVAAHVPNGAKICAMLGTDIVFPCGVSNWGCYAIQAALAILTGRDELAHSVELERRLLGEAPRIGLVDGLTGRREPSVDGLPMEVHLSVVELLATVARRAIAFQKLLGSRGPIYEAEQLARFRKFMI